MLQDCVWRKSSYSDGSGDSNCVEVAFAGAVRVRDSKNAAGPELGFPEGTWRAFLEQLA